MLWEILKKMVGYIVAIAEIMCKVTKGHCKERRKKHSRLVIIMRSVQELVSFHFSPLNPLSHDRVNLHLALTDFTDGKNSTFLNSYCSELASDR